MISGNYLSYLLMSSSIRLFAKEDSGIVLVKVIIPHPNESGSRKDDFGALIPAHFIKEGVVSLNGEPLLQLQLGPAVSKDPFLQFRFKGKRGDQLKLIFTDSRAEQFVAETVVK